MVKLQKGYLKSKLPEALSSSSESESDHEEAPSYDQVDSDQEIAAQEETVEQRFGQRAINDEPRLLERLAEIRGNFYNRLSSQKLINNTKGRIPFSEHMTISKDILFNSGS
jgi:predicted outer membrane protein